jgi:glutathione S-transferase
MLTVWGRRNSINVQKVIWAIAELSLPYQRIDLGGSFGGNRDAEALARNPNGLVPVLLDDNCVIWESNAIVRYLAAKYGNGHLWPVDPGLRAIADRWMDWQLTVTYPALVPLFIQLVRTPQENRNPATISAATSACEAAFSILDGCLSDRNFIGGDQFTMGDIALGCTLHRWYALPIERPKMPSLADYYERLSQRKAFEDQVLSVPLS